MFPLYFKLIHEEIWKRMKVKLNISYLPNGIVKFLLIHITEEFKHLSKLLVLTEIAFFRALIAFPNID